MRELLNTHLSTFELVFHSIYNNYKHFFIENDKLGKVYIWDHCVKFKNFQHLLIFHNQLLIVDFNPEGRNFAILVVVVVVVVVGDVCIVVIVVAARLFVTLTFLSINLSPAHIRRIFFNRFWTSFFDSKHWRRLQDFRSVDGATSGRNNSISGGGNCANFVVSVPIFVLTKSWTIFCKIAAAASFQSLTSTVPTNGCLKENRRKWIRPKIRDNSSNQI